RAGSLQMEACCAAGRVRARSRRCRGRPFAKDLVRAIPAEGRREKRCLWASLVAVACAYVTVVAPCTAVAGVPPPSIPRVSAMTTTVPGEPPAPPPSDVTNRVGDTVADAAADVQRQEADADRKSTRLNSSHVAISYAVFCLKKKKHRIRK